MSLTTLILAKPPAWHKGINLGEKWGTSSRFIGTPIRIHLPPSKPDWHWKCGTKFVWRVSDEDVIRMAGELPPFGHVYACEHQLEMD